MSLNSYSIRIGGIEFSVHSDDENLRLAPLGAAAAFEVRESAAAPSDRFDVAVSRGTIKSSSERTIFSAASWSLHEESDLLIFDVHSSQVPGHPVRRAIVNEGRNLIEAIIDPSFAGRSEPVHPIEYPIDEVIIVNLLPDREAIEVHGCGVVTADGRGLLFAGMSGAGKTTTARMWLDNHPDDRILSDDRIIVRRTGDRFHMFGTPWHGEANLADPGSVPIERLLFLEQDRETRLERVSSVESVSRLLQCSFVPFYRHTLLAKSLEIADELCREIRTEVFHFTKDRAALLNL